MRHHCTPAQRARSIKFSPPTTLLAKRMARVVKYAAAGMRRAMVCRAGGCAGGRWRVGAGWWVASRWGEGAKGVRAAAGTAPKRGSRPVQAAVQGQRYRQRYRAGSAPRPRCAPAQTRPGSGCWRTGPAGRWQGGTGQAGQAAAAGQTGLGTGAQWLPGARAEPSPQAGTVAGSRSSCRKETRQAGRIRHARRPSCPLQLGSP